MFLLVKYGEATTIYGLKLVTTDSTDFQSNPTLASGDVKLSKDGGALANLTTLPVLSPAASTEVQVDLSATETQGRQLVINFVDQTASKEWQDNSYIILTYGHPSAYIPFDLSSASITLTPGGIDAVVAGVYNANRADFNSPNTFGEGVASVRGDVTGEVASLSTTERDAIAAALLDLADAIETGLTVRQAMRLVSAGDAGVTSGAATETFIVKNAVVGDTNRIVATVDEDGNRSAVVLDLD